MSIQNFSTLSAASGYLSNNYQNFSSGSINENSKISASRVDIEKKQTPEDGDTLAISKESGVAAKRLEAPRETVTRINYGTNFSSKPSNDNEVSVESNEQESSLNSNKNNEDVLNQYRFFVQSYQYQDADGAVKRIFR